MSAITRRNVLGALAAVAGLAYLASTLEPQLLINQTVNGIAFGAIFALSGLGLVLTYKATGVFNFAHGAIAMIVAYVFWQATAVWGWSPWVAVAVSVFVVGPAVGVILELGVFRRLQRRGAGTAEKLVRTLAVFTVLVGVAFSVWTGETKTDLAQLFSADRIETGIPGTDLTVGIGHDRLAVLVIVVVASIVLYLLFNHTFLGTSIRATVDRRELAELASINANRVSMIAWALGTTFAGLSGVLLATINSTLDPVRFTLVVIETFAVAVLARLVSLPIAVGGGLFLGLLTTYAQQFSFATLADPFTSEQGAETVARALDQLLVSLPVFVLFGGLLLYRELSEVGEEGASSFGAGGSGGNRNWRRVALAAFALVAVLLPWSGMDAQTWPYVHQATSLAVVFLSIVAVTGFSGHITLGQAAFAGFGAFATGRLAAGSFLGLPAVPMIPAMLLAGLACVPLGLAAGYPALKRRGLFLGLTTLALGLIMTRAVFQNSFFTSGIGILELARPAGLTTDTSFYYFELVVLALAMLLARNLRAGRLGRVLGAMRDSETATRSIGISLRRYKLFIFAVSAFMAGVGGSLLGQNAGSFSHETFNPVISLIWFMIVVVAGVQSIAGAIVAAILLVALNVLIEAGAAQFIIGALALILPAGGIVGAIQRAAGGGWAPRGLTRAYASARGPAPAAVGPSSSDDGHLPSAFAVERLREAREGASR